MHNSAAEIWKCQIFFVTLCAVGNIARAWQKAMRATD